MANGASLVSNGGNIAAQTGNDVTIETIAAGAGSVRVVAGGSIVDQDLVGDGEVDIMANGLQLSAGNAIGSGA
ncbi:hypothetical protein C7C56_000605, partial [Massilia glaciei]